MWHIKVKGRHIRNGKMRSLSSCPVALAIRDMTARRTKVEVEDSRDGVISVGGMEFLIPLRAYQFIRRFDDGKPVKPFTFNLR